MLFMFFEYGRLNKRKWRIALMMKPGTGLLKRGNSSGSWVTFVVCLFSADVLLVASGECDQKAYLIGLNDGLMGRMPSGDVLNRL
jgi:hypothetical protein